MRGGAKSPAQGREEKNIKQIIRINKMLGLNESSDFGLAPGEESPFADCSDPLVSALYGAGIMKGSYNASGELEYRPGANIVRAEAAAVVYRIREHAAP